MSPKYVYYILFGFALVPACLALKPPIHASATEIPPLLDVPTYSMATINADGESTNMNILTYATPVSMRPDRVWAISLYKDTLSFQNFVRTRSCVLQLLTEKHVPLVKLLGGSSGRNVDKQSECSKLGFIWGYLPTGADETVPMVIPDCAYYLKLSATDNGDLVDCGSHSVATCKVDQMFVSSDKTKTDYVSTSRLRALGVITEQGRVADQ